MKLVKLNGAALIRLLNSIKFYFNTTYFRKVNSGVLTCKSKNLIFTNF